MRPAAPRVAPPTASFGRPPEYDEQLDLSREQFDFLSLKSFRRDALLQYDATNQSEPLRIILSFLGILFCLCLPTLNSEAGLENGRDVEAPFAEPGLFVIDDSGLLQITDISNVPFARPDLAWIAKGIGFRRGAFSNTPINGTHA